MGGFSLCSYLSDDDAATIARIMAGAAGNE